MARAILTMILVAGLGWAMAAAPPPRAPAEPEEEEPGLKPKEYELNPIQAESEMRVGRYYLKKRAYRAAAGRFDEATKWNPASAEAFLLLGEARERLKDGKGAKAAYEKYLELAPDGKMAGEVRTRLEKLAKSRGGGGARGG